MSRMLERQTSAAASTLAYLLLAYRSRVGEADDALDDVIFLEDENNSIREIVSECAYVVQNLGSAYLERGEHLQRGKICANFLEARSHSLRFNFRFCICGLLPSFRLDPLVELLFLLLQRPQRLPLEISNCGELPSLGVRVDAAAALFSVAVDIAFVAA